MAMPETSVEDPVAKRALIEKILQRKKALAKEPLGVQTRPDPIPMSFAQERLWYVEQTGMSGGAYNISGGMRLIGPLDVNAMSQALSVIVDRHEALRTRFPTHETQGVQVIDPSLQIVLNPEALVESELAQTMAQFANKTFDLSRDALYRFRLFRIADDIHVLAIVLHHIVSDGWSIGVLTREMASLYCAFVEGKPSPLVPLPLQYVDYAIWQRRVIAADGLEHELSYWRKRLAGAPPSLDLPTDRPRPAIQSSRGASTRVTVSARLVGALSALAQREGATLYMVLLSALQIVLGRWSGHSDIVVGSTIAGRNQTQVESLIGFFINTVALRTDLAGDPTFRELLVQVRNTTLDAYANQSAPFDRVIAEIQPHRDVSRHPVFQVLFVLRNLPERKLVLNGLRVSAIGDGKSMTKMDLSLNLRQTDGMLGGWIEYATDLFDEATVRRLIQNWLTLLDHVVRDAECRIQALQLLSPRESTRLLGEWRGTAAGYEHPEALLHHMFEDWAVRQPESVAVIAGNRRVSYRELNLRANELAQRLLSAGLGRETVVGLRIDRSAELLIGILAILKSGAVYLPLDPALPAERANGMLAEANARILLTCAAVENAEIEAGLRTLHVDSALPLDNAWADLKMPQGHADSLAYVTFTSGSTGKPKGVMTTHRGVVNYLRFLRTHYRLTPADRALNVSSIGFDASMRDFFGPLSSGAAVVIVTDTDTLDATRYWSAICEQRVTRLLSITPSFLRVLCHAAEVAPMTHELQSILTSGEALDGSAVLRVKAVLGEQVEIFNQYGPTECTMTTTWYPASAAQTRLIPIGRSLPNAKVYVLDGNMQPVPVGVVGEMYIGGAGLSRGYAGRPDLSAERFVPDPFEAGTRLYRTGDHVRWDADGLLHYISRGDLQVKLRGMRVELNEIVAVLNSLPDVLQSALVVHGEEEDQRLIAYIVTAQGDLTAERIAEQLKKQLPDTLIPNAFVPIDAIPLTSNGKLDRQALPAFETSMLRGRYTAPIAQTERAIAEIFASLLRVDQVGREDNFFTLGGHSLLTIRVIARIDDVFGVKPTLRRFFEKPTVAALAAEVDELVDEALREADEQTQRAGPASSAGGTAPQPQEISG